MADDSNIFFLLTYTKLSIYIYVEVRLGPNKVYYTILAIDGLIRMTDIAKKIKNATQDAEAKIKTERNMQKPSSETLNKAKVKVRDALT